MNKLTSLYILVSAISIRVLCHQFDAINPIVICVFSILPLTFIPSFKKFHLPIYAGAFLGMGEGFHYSFFFSCMALCVIYDFSSKVSLNAGGKLGFMAFIAYQMGEILWK